MCFTSLYIFSICLLQVCNLSFSFVSMKCLKKLKRITFLFLFNGTFLSDGIVLCLCCAQAVYYSSFTCSCIWPVGCVLRELYSQKRFTKSPSPLWALLQMPCSICSFVSWKKRKRVKSGGGGGRRWGEGLKSKKPLSDRRALLASPRLGFLNIL